MSVRRSRYELFNFLTNEKIKFCYNPFFSKRYCSTIYETGNLPCEGTFKSLRKISQRFVRIMNKQLTTRFVRVLFFVLEDRTGKRRWTFRNNSRHAQLACLTSLLINSFNYHSTVVLTRARVLLNSCTIFLREHEDIVIRNLSQCVNLIVLNGM